MAIYVIDFKSWMEEEVAEFRLVVSWANEERSAGGSRSTELMMTAIRRETRDMTAYRREVK
jgi:hypothetical protein